MVDEKKELRELENRESLKSIEEQWGIFQYSLPHASNYGSFGGGYGYGYGF